MSIRFYSAEDDFCVFPVAPWSRDPDSVASSVVASPSVTRSEPGVREKVRRVRFLDDSGIVGGRVGFPPLGDRSVAWSKRGFTPRYLVNLWGEKYREDRSVFSLKQRNFWFSLGFEWGWDTLRDLKVDREDRFRAVLKGALV